jgi:Ca-activated chloride channel family protein
MINFQAEVIRANRSLTRLGREPLVQIVPREGTMIANSTLGFIEHPRERSNNRKEQFFLSLQRHLTTPRIQRQLRQLGWQAGVSQRLNPQVFQARWGMQSYFNQLPMPRISVVREALELYQETLRQPSLTIFVLDVSGSMRGRRLETLKDAMHEVIHPRSTQRYLIQPTPDDITIVITFSRGIRHRWIVRGNDPFDLRDLDSKVASERAGGKTHLFTALLTAYDEISQHPEFLEGHQPAILLLSDGRPTGDRRTWRDVKRMLRSRPYLRKVPVHPIFFGESDDRLMRDIAHETEGHIIDAHNGDLTHAFRLLQGGH